MVDALNLFLFPLLLMIDRDKRSPSSDINAMNLSQNTYCSWSIFFFTRSV